MLRSVRKSEYFSIINGLVVDLPAPGNLSSWWNYGSLLGLCLVVQILTGFFLSMHYIPDGSYAFDCIVHIMRDVEGGWFLRNVHMNGSSMFFFCVYMHIGRGIYYGSYNKVFVWMTGVSLYILLMIIAFLGYVLPWGQMSFWGATVITNLVSVVPYVGEDLVSWLWGGYCVTGVTLNRFYAFHFLFPFLLIPMSLIHLFYLHEEGSSNPLGVESYSYMVSFFPYYIFKDLLGYFVFFFGFGFFVFFFPFYLGDPVNLIPADPLVTPVHIKPEWYFLWAYALLRSVPNKLGGVVLMFLGVLVLYVFPFISVGEGYGFVFYPFCQFYAFLYFVVFFLLTWVGGSPAEAPFTELGQFSSVCYFLSVWIFICGMEEWDEIEEYAEEVVWAREWWEEEVYWYA